MPVSAIWIASGVGVDVISEQFGVPLALVQAILRYEESPIS